MDGAEAFAVVTICCDLDGVVWLGDAAIEGSADAIAELRAADLPIVFVTNNSNATRVQYAEKLRRQGIDAEPRDILTSSMAAAAMLAASTASGARILVCGGHGVREAVSDAGFRAVDREPADAVVVGWHREFDFDRLSLAADAVRAGARFIATNTDPTYPVPGGVIPGNGAIVAAVATAAGRTPEIAGKPYDAMVQLVRAACPGGGVMIGDRVSTDGALAAALGWPFALVLSGINGATETDEQLPDPPPPFVAADLRALAPLLVHALR